MSAEIRGGCERGGREKRRITVKTEKRARGASETGRENKEMSEYRM